MTFHIGRMIAPLFALLLTATGAQAQTFSNPATITIRDAAPATPYPSIITVSGVSGAIADLNVTLSGYGHRFPDDVDVLLVGPGGQSVVLMSDVGGGVDVSGLTLTLDDEAANSLPDEAQSSSNGPLQLVSGTFRPANFGSPETFPAPAPAAPYGATLSVFDGTAPNGTYSLYVMDDSPTDGGQFAGGFSLSFTTVSDPTGPAALIVTTPADTVANDGVVSLREAINTANADGNSSVISFDIPGAGPHLITLTGGQLTLSQPVDIDNDGPGVESVTVSGNNATRIFNVSTAATVAGLTLANGRDSFQGGGAINVDNGASLTLVNCTLSGNRIEGAAVGGGAIRANFATLTFLNCTFSGNSAVNTSSNSFSSSNGGAIFTNASAVTLRNCTLTNNSASSPNGGGSGGGGDFNGGSLVIANTIVAGNNADSRPNLRRPLTTTDGGGNIIGGDARLGPLQNNGGLRETHVLLAGSPALNAGVNAQIPADISDSDGDGDTSEAQSFDERGVGFPRVQAGVVDSGAFELAPSATGSLVVTTTNDEDNGTSDPAFGTGTSLREAIGFANTNADPSAITFSARFNTAQTITLGGTQLVISQTVSITGPGANLLSVSGNNLSRVFLIQGGTATLSGLTITGGRAIGDGNGGAGGGIFVTSPPRNGSIGLNLLNCALSGNTADTFGGALLIFPASLPDPFQSTSNTTIDKCTFDNNTANGPASGGGAIKNTAALSITNSTFSNNRAPSSDGGGAIDNSGPLTLTHCTLTGNNGGRGAGGIVTNRTVTLSNTIIAGNVNNTAQADVATVVNNGFTSGGYNLIGNAGAVAFNAPGDQKGTAAAPLDPRLAPLALNAPGTTQTHSLQIDSPAVNAGSPTPASTSDQRGVARPQVGRSDIGAFELEASNFSPSLVVTTLADEDNGTSDARVGTGTSLREAINFANENVDPSAITFSPTVFNTTQTITLSRGELNITADTTIDGPDDAITTVSGNGASRVFFVNGGTSTIDDLIIANGNGAGGGIDGSGGCVAVIEATLSLSRCVVTGGSSSGGGGILVLDATLNLSNCTLVRNDGANQGGAIDNNVGGTTNISNCTITDNTTSNTPSRGGGGIVNFGTLNINNSIVAGNTSVNGPDIYSGTGSNDSLNSGGFNLIGTPVNNPYAPFTPAASDQVGTSDATPLLPGFERDAASGNRPFLKDNGGGTLSIALLVNSPAVNRGDTTLTEDQRNVARPQGGQDDIGAFESSFVANRAPSVSDIAISVDEDGTLGLSAATFDAAFSDPDVNSLQSVRIDSLPTQGTLKLNGAEVTLNQVIARADLANLTYEPKDFYNGADAFDFNASDGTLFAAESATVNITVNAVSTPSLTNADEYETNEDTALNVAAPGVLGNDVNYDTDPIFAEKVADPAHGTLTLNADGSFLYVPNANFNGTDTFTYNSTDGDNVDGNTATVTITVRAVNDAPVARDDSISTPAFTPVGIAVLANDTDADSSTLTLQSVTQPARGSVVINSDGTLTYTGDGTLGEDSFSYTISDGQGSTATAKVTVTRTLPASTPNAKVTGSGAIRVAGGSASFSLSVQVKNGTPTGSVSFDNSPGGVFVRSLRITAIVLGATGTTARIYGTAKVNGAGSIDFFVEVEDASEPGVGADTFRIVAGSYSAQGVLSSGNIQVHKAK